MRRLLALLMMVSLLTGSAYAEGKVIVDESAYCRVYVEYGLDTISPEILKSKGKELLDARAFGALKNQVKRRWSHRGWKWDESTWMDRALIGFVGLQSGDRSACDTLAWTPPPVEGWTALDFDDSTWLRQRFPVMVGPHGGHTDACLSKQRGCFRFPFYVSDPTKAQNLMLNIVYRGGVRVVVNGKEITRGSLPDGEITSSVFATDYPVAAYGNMDENGKIKINTDRRGGKSLAYIGNFFGSFENATPQRDQKGKPIPGTKMTHGGRKAFALRESEWNRLQGLRDRKLENVTIPRHLLRKGRNVLAVEIRASRLNPICSSWATSAIAENQSWDHCHLVDLELIDPSGAIRSGMERVGGTQVWAEDMHRRILSTEYGDPGAPKGTVRFVGALGGSFSAQVLVSTDKALSDLNVSVSDLKSDSGKTLAAAAIRVRAMKHRPISEMNRLGFGRGGGDLDEVLHGAIRWMAAFPRARSNWPRERSYGPHRASNCPSICWSATGSRST